MAQTEELTFFAGRVCCLCGAGLSRGRRLCDWCRLRLYESSDGHDAFGVPVRSALLHAGSGGWLVRRLKFDRVRAAAAAAAEIIRKRLDDWMVASDWLVPMPLSRKRLRARGFNQALLISRHLSRLTGVPVARLLSRRHRRAQVGLDREERRRNVRGAYRCRRPPQEGARICLVDDVMTTGSSLGDAGRALREGGADQVRAVTLTYRSPRSL